VSKTVIRTTKTNFYFGSQPLEWKIPKTPQNDGEPNASRSWEKPEENFTKVNFDTAFEQSSGNGAWGFVARTEQEKFIAAGKLRHLPYRTLQR
jgi:hypothetical protein